MDPPLVLAPMADVTNGPFRRICKRIGMPGLVCTEQISVSAYHFQSERTFAMFDWTDDERPISVQLFGADPSCMAETARAVVEHGADIIDINMGCWVPKVCRQGAGAALLKDEATALRVVEAVVKAVDVPVTVKMRAGWDGNELTSASLAFRLEELGVCGFTLHARMARQGFEGVADWKWIREIKQTVSKPVVGNGDIRQPNDAIRMLNETGCEGIMIGRAAIGNPWLLRDTARALQGLPQLLPPRFEERVAVALEHVSALAASIGERRAVHHLRGQLPIYIKGYSGASQARERVNHADTISEIRAIFEGMMNR